MLTRELLFLLSGSNASMLSVRDCWLCVLRNDFDVCPLPATQTNEQTKKKHVFIFAYAISILCSPWSSEIEPSHINKTYCIQSGQHSISKNINWTLAFSPFVFFFSLFICDLIYVMAICSVNGKRMNWTFVLPLNLYTDNSTCATVNTWL